VSDIAHLQTEDFHATANFRGTDIAIALVGTVDQGAVEALERFLEKVHTAATSRPVGEAAVDMRKLEFMNSSGFKLLVAWIAKIQGLDPGARYRLQFVSNPELHWQKRSLRSLQYFAVDLVSIVT